MCISLSHSTQKVLSNAQWQPASPIWWNHRLKYADTWKYLLTVILCICSSFLQHRNTEYTSNTVKSLLSLTLQTMRWESLTYTITHKHKYHCWERSNHSIGTIPNNVKQTVIHLMSPKWTLIGKSVVHTTSNHLQPKETEASVKQMNKIRNVT